MEKSSNCKTTGSVERSQWDNKLQFLLTCIGMIFLVHGLCFNSNFEVGNFTGKSV